MTYALFIMVGDGSENPYIADFCLLFGWDRDGDLCMILNHRYMYVHVHTPLLKNKLKTKTKKTRIKCHATF